MKKILIVDDMGMWREFHKKAVKELFADKASLDIAENARKGYNKIIENIEYPYDIIITDLQMEEDFAPKYAGEWLVENVKTLPQYFRTQIIIISASYKVQYIAKNLNVDYISKSSVMTNSLAYKELLK